MNAYASKEELTLLPANRISYPEHYADARSTRPGIVSAITSKLVAFFQRQRVMAELSNLSDRELADIGLTRADLSVVFQPGYAKQGR